MPTKIIMWSAITTVAGAYLFEKLGVKVKGF